MKSGTVVVGGILVCQNGGFYFKTKTSTSEETQELKHLWISVLKERERRVKVEKAYYDD